MRILFCNYQQIKFESIIVKLASNVLLVVRAGGVGSVQAVHSVHSLPVHPPGEGLVDAQGVARGVPVLHLNLRTTVQNRLSEQYSTVQYRCKELTITIQYKSTET